MQDRFHRNGFITITTFYFSFDDLGFLHVVKTSIDRINFFHNFEYFQQLSRKII